MLDLERFQKSKRNLEERLRLLADDTSTPEQHEIEIATYDLMVETMQDRNFRIRSEIFRRHNSKRPGEQGYFPSEFERIAAEIAKVSSQITKDNPDLKNDELVYRTLSHDRIARKRDKFNQDRLADAHQDSATYGHKPAYIIVLHYDPEKHEHGIIDANYKHPLVQGKYKIQDMDDDAKRLFIDHAYQDGAILVNPQGLVVAGNAELVYDPAALMSGSIHIERGQLNAFLGFDEDVHTRHHAAIYASLRMKGTATVILGEKEGQTVQQDIRRCYMGKISNSTNAIEDARAMEWILGQAK